MSIITPIPHFPRHSQGFCCRTAIELVLSVGLRRLAHPCPSAIVSSVVDSLYNLRLVLHKKQLSVPTFRPVPYFRLQYHCSCQLTEIRFTHRPSTLPFSHLELRSPNISHVGRTEQEPGATILILCPSEFISARLVQGKRNFQSATTSLSPTHCLGDLCRSTPDIYRSQPWRPHTATWPCRGLPPASFLPAT